MPITVTLVSGTSGLSQTDMLAYARKIGWNRNDNNSVQMLRDAINDGLRELADFCDWPYYQTAAKLKLPASLSSTCTLAEDAKTASSATITSAWAGGDLRFTDGYSYYFIKSAASGSSAVLESAYLGESQTAAACEVAYLRHILPDDFRRMKEPVEG